MPAAWYFARLGLSGDALLNGFSREFDVSLEPEKLMPSLVEAYREGLRDLRVIEVVASVARRYQGRVPMAVASAAERPFVEETLKAAGIRDLFQEIVTVDDVGGRTKPAPDLFLEAARRLGVRATECTVFEDTDEELEAARGAGMSATDVRSIYRHAWRDAPDG